MGKLYINVTNQYNYETLKYDEIIPTNLILVGYGGNMKENEREDKEVQQADEGEEIEGKKKIFDFRELDWRKTPDFQDKTADIVATMISERFVILDFGSFDYDAREPRTFAPVNPSISYHTRIRVTPDHLKDIVEILNRIVEEGGRGEE